MRLWSWLTHRRAHHPPDANGAPAEPDPSPAEQRYERAKVAATRTVGRAEASTRRAQRVSGGDAFPIADYLIGRGEHPPRPERD